MVHDAIKALHNHLYRYDIQTVIDVDLANFFSNIRQDLLVKLLKRRISDPRVLKLIRAWLQAGVMEEGRFEKG